MVAYPVTSVADVVPSGDLTGAGDAARILAAVAALPSGGGSITLAPGNWNLVPGAVTINPAKPVWIFAWGAVFNPVGNTAGSLFRIYDSSTISLRGYYGGGFTGGTAYVNVANGQYFIHVGDIFGYEIDVRVINSSGTGGKGVWFDNNYYWTEEAKGFIYAQGCSVVLDNSTGVSLSAGCTGSFDRWNVTTKINTLGLCDGMVVQNGAISVNHGPTAAVTGNMSTGLSSYAALRINGSNGIGHSYLTDGPFTMGVECDDTVHTAPQTIAFGSSANQFLRNTGQLSFNTNDAFAVSNGTSANFSYIGEVNGDSTLAFLANNYPSPVGVPLGMYYGSYTGAQSITANAWSVNPSVRGYIAVTCAGPFTGGTLNNGSFDGQFLMIANQGSGLLTFAAAGTSNVASGVSATIPALGLAVFVWSGTANLWYQR